jgi:urease accessory protein
LNGDGLIRVARAEGRNVVLSSRASSPLRLLRTRGEQAAWIFATTFGGGLVDGDRIALDVDVDEGARILLTTQASTKVYRSPHGTESVIRARVARDGMFASIPDPTVCFAGARYTQTIDVDVQGSAAIVDVLHAGRVSRGERWAMDHYRSTLRVNDIRDTLLLDPAHGSIAARMNRFDVLGTVILIGPLLAAARARIATEMIAPARGAECVVAASVRDELMLVRFAATRAEVATACLRSLLTETFSLVGDVLARKR